MFFKRKRKKEDTSFSSYRNEMIKSAKEKMLINYLSPSQVDKIIKQTEDLDFLDDSIKKEMENPDLEFLSKKLMPSTLSPNNTRKNIKAKDVVKATCLGDIIGSEYEFTQHDYSSTQTEPLPTKHSRFTDDSVLSIATMNAILKDDKNPDFRQAYIDAYHKHPNAGYGSAFVSWACGERMFYVENMENGNIDNTKGYHSFGDGCAMRISFIPAYYENVEDVIKYTIQSVMVTHNHVESVKGSVVLAVSIWMLLHNYSKEDVFKYCKKHYCCQGNELDKMVYKRSYFHLDTILATLSNKEDNVSLFVNYAVPFAIKCFYTTNSYEECMREILSHFCDTDTICAIAGTLCYAYYGTTGFDIDTILSKQKLEI